jgi:hypothetical protein
MTYLHPHCLHRPCRARTLHQRHRWQRGQRGDWGRRRGRRRSRRPGLGPRPQQQGWLAGLCDAGVILSASSAKARQGNIVIPLSRQDSLPSMMLGWLFLYLLQRQSNYPTIKTRQFTQHDAGETLSASSAKAMQSSYSNIKTWSN